MCCRVYIFIHSFIEIFIQISLHLIKLMIERRNESRALVKARQRAFLGGKELFALLTL